MPLVYCATNNLNDHQYVGVTKFTLERRRREHKKEAKRNANRMAFHAAIRKYGWDSFRWSVLAEFTSYEDALAAEVQTIAELKPYYNITIGGAGIPISIKTIEFIEDFETWEKNGCRDIDALEALLQRAKQLHVEPVICLNECRYFPTITAAAKHYGVGTSYVAHVLAGAQRKTKGHYFARAERAMSVSECAAIIASSKADAKAVRAAINLELMGRGGVVCLNDGLEFESGPAAAAKYGVLAPNLYKVCNNERAHTEGFVFAWKSENLPPDKITKRLQAALEAQDIEKRKWQVSLRRGHEKNKRPVICLSDGIVYRAVQDAAAAYGADASSISEICHGSKVRKSAAGRKFAFVENNNADPVSTRICQG